MVNICLIDYSYFSNNWVKNFSNLIIVLKVIEDHILRLYYVLRDYRNFDVVYLTEWVFNNLKVYVSSIEKTYIIHYDPSNEFLLKRK